MLLHDHKACSFQQQPVKSFSSTKPSLRARRYVLVNSRRMKALYLRRLCSVPKNTAGESSSMFWECIKIQALCVYERSSEIFKVTAFHNSIRSFFCCRKGDWPTPTWNLSIFNWNHRKKINSPPPKKLIPKIIPHPIKLTFWNQRDDVNLIHFGDYLLYIGD